MAEQPVTQWPSPIPESAEWQGLEPSIWLINFGSPAQAIAYSTLFLPTFVEYGGCLLWEGMDLSTLDQWLHTFAGDITSTEKKLNHRHLTSIFTGGEFESPEQITYLGELLQKIWTLKLRNDFPNLNVQVEFYWNDPEDDDDAQMTVFCLRP